jgi:hypothetical protein
MVNVSLLYSAQIQRQCSPGAALNVPGESNLTLITWFPHRSPLYRWMRLIKRCFLVTGLVILKLTHPLIPAKNPNSSNFYGTEGVAWRKGGCQEGTNTAGKVTLSGGGPSDG